ncbi:hypothetical protein pmac_cds_107 [Pandoravirus macleodensis]|uniref:Uncharacterized protein n=1 Tax=Pandoravirus macleodensis TaxID=2107707 RepID=A0A2U7UEL9_9VIRU|nr:hypothetical protein pmac_cds_107 [Pandoravirus macleodensis]AVK76795.1 hypothetical protein pmac_cds_107 [Pandoravirus macleodensis]UMO79362.1 hypothetical protein [Pandoravirus aubagnensis]
MGTTHSLVSSPCWDDDDNDEVNDETIAIEKVDVSAASRVEYKHNQKVVYETITCLPVGCAFSIGLVHRTTGAPDVCGIDVQCKGNDQYSMITSGPTSCGWPVWSARLLARAVSVLSLSHIVCLVPGMRMTDGDFAPLPIEAKIVQLRDRMWVPTLVRTLAEGPATRVWTGDAIAQMRLLASSVARTVTARASCVPFEQSSLGAVACANLTRDAVRHLCESQHIVCIKGHAMKACLDHVADLERNLQWMASWLDGLERTHAISTHLLGHGPD